MRLIYPVFLLIAACSNPEQRQERQVNPALTSAVAPDTIAIVESPKEDSINENKVDLIKTEPQKAKEKTATLKLINATVQITNHGAAPGQTYNYNIELSSESNDPFKITGVTSVADKKPLDYKLTSNSGIYRIGFGIFKQHETDRRGRPVEPIEISNDLSKGVNIYYILKEKPLTLSVKGFKELKTIDAP